MWKQFPSAFMLVFSMAACVEDDDKAVPCTDLEYNVAQDEAEPSCHPLTVCQEGEYESLSPTENSDRQCSLVTDCEPGQYIYTAATATADRDCRSCEELESYSDEKNTESCIEVTSCLSNEYIDVASTLTSDVICGDCTAEIPVEKGECIECENGSECSTASCLPGYANDAGNCQQVETPPNSICLDSDNGVVCACEPGYFGVVSWDQAAESWLGTCSLWTDCQPGEYISQSGTALTDRECSACTLGVDYSAELNAESCFSITDCEAGQYITGDAQVDKDRECASCTVGVDYSTAVNSLSCTPVINCVAGEYVLNQASESSDYLCDSCPAEEFSEQENAASCHSWSNCPAGMYIEQAGTATSDRGCDSCSLGVDYSTLENAESCTVVSECVAGEYVLAAASLTTDISCDSCPSGSYADTINSASCSPWTDCVAGEYIQQAGTRSLDRECTSCTLGVDYSTTENATSCTAVTDCSVGEYILEAATLSTDRECDSCPSGSYADTLNSPSCSPWTDCVAGEYIQQAGSGTSDRGCDSCSLGVDYSTTENAVSCTGVSACIAGEYVLAAATLTTDISCDSCPSNSYSDTVNSPSCSPWTDCVAGEYIQQAGTSIIDRQCDACTLGVDYSKSENSISCAPLTECGADEYEVIAPAVDTDRECETLFVSLVVTDDQAYEGGQDTATVQVHLSAAQQNDIEVFFTLTGSAHEVDDYLLFTQGVAVVDSVIVPAGQSTLDITLEPVVSAGLEVMEYATFTLSTSNDYAVEPTDEEATVLIAEYGPSNGNTYYVDESGDDNNVGSELYPFATINYAISQLTAGDTLYIKDGTYTNDGYSATHGASGDTNISNARLARISNSGTSDNWITIAAYPDDNQQKPLLTFDGGGGIQIDSGVRYVRIEGLEIQGPNAEITYDWAHEHRWSKENFYTGRGIFSWGPVDHIVVRNCDVHHTPGSGIRFNKADYILVENNTVSNTTWWSSSAESAIVIATAEHVDSADVVKFLYSGNIVYNNWNFLEFCSTPFANSTDDEYGNCDYYTGGIIDGQGLYVTRNMDTYLYGRMRFENNITFNNGFGGVVYHKTNRGELVNNLVFMNGAYPGISNYSGLTVNTVDDLLIMNNLIWARDSNDYGMKNNGNTSNITATNNYVVGKSQYGLPTENTVLSFTDAPALAEIFSAVVDISGASPDPHSTTGDYAPANIDDFIQSYGLDFALVLTATDLIDAGESVGAPSTDLEGNSRPQGGGVDIGPFEY